MPTPRMVAWRGDDVSGQTFSYDYMNRLATITEGSERTEYIYDAGGARVGRKESGIWEYYVVDPQDTLKRPLAVINAQGQITRYYVWAGYRLLCHIEADGTIRYYHADELGSTLALTDDAGNVTDQVCLHAIRDCHTLRQHTNAFPVVGRVRGVL